MKVRIRVALAVAAFSSVAGTAFFAFADNGAQAPQQPRPQQQHPQQAAADATQQLNQACQANIQALNNLLDKASEAAKPAIQKAIQACQNQALAAATRTAQQQIQTMTNLAGKLPAADKAAVQQAIQACHQNVQSAQACLNGPGNGAGNSNGQVAASGGVGNAPPENSTAGAPGGPGNDQSGAAGQPAPGTGGPQGAPAVGPTVFGGRPIGGAGTHGRGK